MILPGIVSGAFIKGTAEVNTHWVKGGTAPSFTFTYNNPAGSEPALCIRIDRPNANYTLTGGSASGWSESHDSTKVNFTGGSIPGGGNANFIVTTNVGLISDVQSAWRVWGSKNANCVPPSQADPSYSGALHTGIDGSAPINNGVGSVTANSTSQITILANAGADNESGLNSSPYQFNETTGGGHSSGWQASTTYVDNGLSPNIQYTYRVKVRDAMENESGYSPTASTYTFANQPAGGSFSGVTTTSIKANWTSNSNPGGTEYYCENATAGTNSGWTTNLSWDSGGLAPNTSYTFHVRARNGDGVETGWYDIGSQTTGTTPGGDGGDGEPEPVGPKPSTPYVAPPPAAADIGAPGTTTPDLSILGGTTTLVPIKCNSSDKVPPDISISQAPADINHGSKFSLTARAAEAAGVVAEVGYSLDKGLTWHPVTSSNGIGTKTTTFSIESFPLDDEDYIVLLRSKDNCANEATSSEIKTTIDTQSPRLISLTPKYGAEEITSKAIREITVSANLRFELLTSFTGGPSEVTLVVGDKEFKFEHQYLSEFWRGDVIFGKEGTYQGKLIAEDSAGNKLEQQIFNFIVTEPLVVKTGLGKEAMVYEFNDQDKNWQMFNGQAYLQDNPNKIDEINQNGLLLPAGRYYIKIPYSLFGASKIFSQDETSAISGNLSNILPSVNIVDSTKLQSEKKVPESAVEKVLTETNTSKERNTIIYNFNPKSFACLEELFTLEEFIDNAKGSVDLVVVVPSVYRAQVEALAARGTLNAKFFYDDGEIQEELFSYRAPAMIFTGKSGGLSVISGFLNNSDIEKNVKGE